jgi:hypothetical protein
MTGRKRAKSLPCKCAHRRANKINTEACLFQFQGSFCGRLLERLLSSRTCSEKKKDLSSHFNCTRELPHRPMYFQMWLHNSSELFVSGAYDVAIQPSLRRAFRSFCISCGRAPIRVAERIELEPIYSTNAAISICALEIQFSWFRGEWRRGPTHKLENVNRMLRRCVIDNKNSVFRAFWKS